MSLADSLYNLQLVQEFCREHLARCCHFALEDMLYAAASIKVRAPRPPARPPGRSGGRRPPPSRGLSPRCANVRLPARVPRRPRGGRLAPALPPGRAPGGTLSACILSAPPRVWNLPVKRFKLRAFYNLQGKGIR